MSHWPVSGYLISSSIALAFLLFPKLSLMLLLNKIIPSPPIFPQSLRLPCLSCFLASLLSGLKLMTEVYVWPQIAWQRLGEQKPTEGWDHLSASRSRSWKPVADVRQEHRVEAQEEATVLCISDWMTQSLKLNNPNLRQQPLSQKHFTPQMRKHIYQESCWSTDYKSLFPIFLCCCCWTYYFF